MENLWKTYGKRMEHLENLWTLTEFYGKVVDNFLKIIEKLWINYEKPMEIDGKPVETYGNPMEILWKCVENLGNHLGNHMGN